MSISDAKRKADTKYRKKAYDQIAIRVPKGKREEWKALADRRGESLAGIITRLLEEELKKEE